MAADGGARAAAISTGSRTPGPWWLQVVEAWPDGVPNVDGDGVISVTREIDALARIGRDALVAKPTTALRGMAAPRWSTS